MNATFYPALRLIQIGAKFFTVLELERKTDRTQQETQAMRDGRRIFRRRKEKNPLFVAPFEDGDEVKDLVESDMFKLDFHSQCLLN